MVELDKQPLLALVSRYRIFFGLGVVIVALLLIFFSGGDEEQAPPIIRPVVTMKIGGIDTERFRSFSGVAQPVKELKLSFRVSGEIVRLDVDVGQTFNAGDIIAQLDPTDYELRVKLQEASFAEANARLKQARSEYDRIRTLFEAGNASASQLDESQANFRSGQAKYEAEEKSLELAQQRLGYCTLRAPVKGQVSTVLAEVNQVVQQGSVIATLTAEEGVEVKIGVPEAIIGRLKMGYPGQVRFDVIPEESFSAKISELGVAATAATTYPVTMAFKKSDPRLRAGMVAEVTFQFEVESSRRVLTVPAVAVIGASGGKNYIWLYRADSSTVTRHEVTIGELTSAGLQIFKGLKAGDVIVTRGVHHIEEGMKVRLMEP